MVVTLFVLVADGCFFFHFVAPLPFRHFICHFALSNHAKEEENQAEAAGGSNAVIPAEEGDNRRRPPSSPRALS